MYFMYSFWLSRSFLLVDRNIKLKAPLSKLLHISFHIEGLSLMYNLMNIRASIRGYYCHHMCQDLLDILKRIAQLSYHRSSLTFSWKSKLVCNTWSLGQQILRTTWVTRIYDLFNEHTSLLSILLKRWRIFWSYYQPNRTRRPKHIYEYQNQNHLLLCFGQSSHQDILLHKFYSQWDHRNMVEDIFTHISWYQDCRMCPVFDSHI